MTFEPITPVLILTMALLQDRKANKYMITIIIIHVVNKIIVTSGHQHLVVNLKHRENYLHVIIVYIIKKSAV